MPISISCPECGKGYNLADTQRGKTVVCRNCDTPFVAEDEEDDRPARGRRDEDEEDDRPRSRRDEYDDDEEDRPRRHRRDDDDDRPQRSRRDDDYDDEEDRPRRSLRDEFEEEDDRPRRSRRDEDDEDDQPRRSRRDEDEDEEDEPVLEVIEEIEEVEAIQAEEDEDDRSDSEVRVSHRGRDEDEEEERPRPRKQKASAGGGGMKWLLIGGGGGLILLLVLCGGVLYATGVLGSSRVTQENYKKLTHGMSQREVEEILGTGKDITQEQLRNLDELVGPGMAKLYRNSNYKALLWESGNNKIQVVMLNGRATEFSGEFTTNTGTIRMRN